MTERRVSITLNLATDLEEGIVLASLLQQLPPDILKIVAGTNVHVFDPTTYRDDETRAFLVLGPTGNLAKVHVDDEDAATNHAKALDGLLIELNVTEDFRTPTTPTES
jgi:hypothetical protein